jgi:TorA-specific chaperone
MQEFMATSERRAELYWWFSTLFAAELSDEQIAEYDTYDVRSFLKSLSTLDPMREAVAELNDAIARLLVRTDRQLELAADFAGLFLVDPKQGALPYESLYRGEAKLLMQAPMAEMQARLDRLGINVSDKYKEPADHLAIELDLMGNLIIRAAEAKSAAERESWLDEQEALLHGHLLGWFDKLRDRLSRRRPVWLLRRQRPSAGGIPHHGCQLPLSGQTGAVRRLSLA